MSGKYRVVITGHPIGFRMMWVNDDNVKELLTNPYLIIQSIYRTGTDQKPIMKDGELLWQDMKLEDYVLPDENKAVNKS